MTKGTSVQRSNKYLGARGMPSKPPYSISHLNSATGPVLQAVTYDIWSTRIQRYQPNYLELLLAHGNLTFLYLQKKRIASFVCQLVPTFSLTYFLPITHTCLISASSLSLGECFPLLKDLTPFSRLPLHYPSDGQA